ncbi:type II toxin-antitoxin system ParD family antitoxin [Rhizobium redzepovicii]|uniref:Type II toxin-antitoxin system ParD family antitoxin n=1 Tax=Rhizobium redzepovicii TaxID=2867518 RepID=A0AAW8NZ24_9HYPH|nr:MULTISPECIES: type II toxin-antitoxin system ParD family antitoxin [Rhizobium]MBB3523389.1 putative addiction module CopG family antidote [Rhizobium sp. BK456]MDF0662285.1 type II toxin-antitoxin system ParD family antitoxin [Rhizobium sp. BC49]MDR9760007.1 type II toxin-antitoxin system ParD family antitoxin [Rhizobium redzepovicii]MDR9780472.1 type II toxin-antitoxin system ParD family antitoxin [Rhizobium redzepovicii]RFB88425.1 plasmid stabilization protein [Rhizobium leguminosarum bv. 
MRSTQQMSITLPVEMAKRVKQRVSDGDYASESEVIREGLRALQERENAVEHWLRTEVVATYDAHKADPTKAKPLEEVWKRLEARMDEIDREDD